MRLKLRLLEPGLSLVLAVAVIVSIPPLFLGFPAHTSDSGHDAGAAIVYLDRFARQFWQGDFYPRWLVTGDNGFGQPAFYFYQPLGYWIGAVLRGPGDGWIATDQALALSLLFGRMLAGWGMLAWLSRHVATRPATFGALFYILCTYTLDINVYARTAYAETMALSFFPLVMIGVDDVLDGRRHGTLRLAAAMAFATLAHVVSPVVLVVPCAIYACVLGWRSPLRVLLVGAGAAFGLLADGFFLVPALTLQSLVHADALYAHIRPEDWFLEARFFRHDHAHFLLLFLGAAGVAMGTWAALAMLAPQRRPGRFETAAVLCCGASLVMCTGLSGPLWHPALPFALMQFPWRLFGAMSLMGAAALAAAYSRCAIRRRDVVAGMALLIGVLPTAWSLHDFKFSRAAEVLRPRSGEHEPAEFIKEFVPRSWTGPMRDERIDAWPRGLEFRPRDAGMVQGSGWYAGRLAVSVVSPAGGLMVVPQHFFPSWRAVDEAGQALEVSAVEPWGLLGVRVPAGTHRVVVERAMLPQEQAGWVLSLVCWVGMLAAGLRRRGASRA